MTTKSVKHLLRRLASLPDDDAEKQKCMAIIDLLEPIYKTVLIEKYINGNDYKTVAAMVHYSTDRTKRYGAAALKQFLAAYELWDKVKR